MKLIVAFCILSALAMTGKKPEKIIFFGDSITEVAVQKGGYIDLINTRLSKNGVADNFMLEGAGVSGNKVYDLYLRLDEDVLSKNPDKVIIWVGVNDVWHKEWGTGTDADKFEKFYIALIKKMQAQNIQLLLVTPAVIGEKHDGSNPFDKDLDAYSEIIRKLAVQFNCKLLDCRNLFMAYSKNHNPQNKDSGILTDDRVHLNHTGNQLVADALWKLLF